MRKIRFDDEWYCVGDTVLMKEYITFLNIVLPFSRKKKWIIKYIGCDSTCIIHRNDIQITVTGEVIAIND